MRTVGKDRKNYPIPISYLLSGVLIARLVTCLTALSDSCSMLKEAAKIEEKNLSVQNPKAASYRKRKRTTCEKLKFPMFQVTYKQATEIMKAMQNKC